MVGPLELKVRRDQAQRGARSLDFDQVGFDGLPFLVEVSEVEVVLLSVPDPEEVGTAGAWAGSMGGGLAGNPLADADAGGGVGEGACPAVAASGSGLQCILKSRSGLVASRLKLSPGCSRADSAVAPEHRGAGVSNGVTPRPRGCPSTAYMRT